MLKPLDKSNSKVLGSKNDIEQEIRKCKSDPVFFAKNYVYVKHPTRGQVKFNLFQFQEEVLKQFRSNRFNIILKSRQLGLTELMATYILWYCLFFKDKNILVISKNREAASNLIKRIKYSYKKLPSWLKITKYETNNVFSVEFDNDSRIYAAASTSDAGRSESCSLLIVDEAAFINGLEETWASLFPIVSTGGEVIVNSTPLGTAGAFYNLYTQAPGNGFNPIKLNWDVHPERDQIWYDKTKKMMSPRKFAREYLCSFELSGDTVIEPEDLAYVQSCIKEPKEKIGPNKNLWIWKDRNPMHRYCVGVDVARGDGQDFSAFVIIDVDSGEIVAEYLDKIKVDRFGQFIYDVCVERYGTPLVVVENNNHGLVVLMKLIDLKYPNLYWTEKGTQTYVEGYVSWDEDDVVPGFTTTMSSKILAMDKFEENIRLRKTQIYSERMLNHLQNFVYVNGKPKAREGANDDLVMAFAIGVYIAGLVFPERNENTELKLRLLQNISLVEQKVSSKLPYELGYEESQSPYDLDPNDPYKANLKMGLSVDFRCFVDKPTEKKELKESFITFLGTIR